MQLSDQEMRAAIDQTIADSIRLLTAENFSGPGEQPVLRQFHDSMRWNVTTILPVHVYVTDATRTHTFFSNRQGAEKIRPDVVSQIYAGLPTFIEIVRRRITHIERTRAQPETVRLSLIPEIGTA